MGMLPVHTHTLKLYRTIEAQSTVAFVYHARIGSFPTKFVPRQPFLRILLGIGRPDHPSSYLHNSRGVVCITRVICATPPLSPQRWHLDPTSIGDIVLRRRRSFPGRFCDEGIEFDDGSKEHRPRTVNPPRPLRRPVPDAVGSAAAIIPVVPRHIGVVFVRQEHDVAGRV